MNQFYVGQEVACIRAGYDPKQNVSIPCELVVGQTYKIRWIGNHRHYLDGDYVGIRVEGIDRGTCQIWGDVDTPFRASRFRPLVSDPLAELRNLAVDPDGYKPDAPEGPVRDEPLPDDGEGVKEREKEDAK